MKISLLSTLSNDSHTNTLCKVDLSEVTFGERRIYSFCCCLFVCFFLRLEESSHMLITILFIIIIIIIIIIGLGLNKHSK